jgi:hypothetical protein
MKFPAYVPKMVRKYIASFLDGDEIEPVGWNEVLESAEQRLAEIEGAIARRTRQGETDYLPSLRDQKNKAIEHRDMLAEEVNCLKRLAQDSRMQEVYAKLTQEFSEDQQCRDFINAANSARMDYSKYRDRLNQVAELNRKISKTSSKLAQLLRDTEQTGFSHWPSEFFSIPELLRHTDNHDMDDHNLLMWQSMRGYILGEPHGRDSKEAELVEESAEPPNTPEFVHVILKPLEKADIDPKEEVRNTLRYAWGTAPELSELLGTVSNVARAFNPSEGGMIGEAIRTRQGSKAENKAYIRAFGHQLTKSYRITLTTNVMKAMAITATVVINDPEFVATYDDVVKAIRQPVETRQ